MNFSTQSALRFLILIGITATVAIFLFQAAGAAEPAQTVSRARATAPTGQSLADLETRLQQFIKQQVSDKFADSARDLIEKANRATESAETLLSVMKWISSGWFAVVTLVFGALLFIGWREYGLIKTAKELADKAASDAKTSADKAKGVEEDVRHAAERLQAIDEGVRQAIGEIQAYFQQLPVLARLGIVGELSELPPSEQLTKFEEADVIIVIAEKIKAVPQSTLIESFVRLGLYWRLIENYTRAIARFRKAIELDPRCADARR